jgi:hypothetical protein
MTDHPKPPDAPASGGMSDAARQRVLADLADGRDATNPAFLYSVTAAPLLLAVAAGLIDPVALARRELASRGLDESGEWVGFDRARQIHGVAR